MDFVQLAVREWAKSNPAQPHDIIARKRISMELIVGKEKSSEYNLVYENNRHYHLLPIEAYFRYCSSSF